MLGFTSGIGCCWMLPDCDAAFRSSAAYRVYPFVLYGYGSSESALIPAQIPAISFDTPAPMVWNRMHESRYCPPYRPRLKPPRTAQSRRLHQKQQAPRLRYMAQGCCFAPLALRCQGRQLQRCRPASTDFAKQLPEKKTRHCAGSGLLHSGQGYSNAFASSITSLMSSRLASAIMPHTLAASMNSASPRYSPTSSASILICATATAKPRSSVTC